MGFESTAGFPVWLLKQRILFVQNEFLNLYESVRRKQSQGKQFKCARLPFLAPRRCSPAERLGQGRFPQPAADPRDGQDEEEEEEE